ncbi:MAG TPA: type II toxin-antitoxin system VapB family antitoxin [Candidatus Paceibacterota bacterium]|nr:type II toxin-antitoxin system VapB family antitoxin [Candidatus Paceibacterota bacterium]
MKMTLHIDDALLARVMKATGTSSKTQAVDLALREMDRRAKLVSLCSAGLGLPPDALKDAIDPAYNLKVMRQLEIPAHYGRKTRSRR